jgi:quinoprotein relay system zinc metallohydrolase 2
MPRRLPAWLGCLLTWGGLGLCGMAGAGQGLLPLTPPPPPPPTAQAAAADFLELQAPGVYLHRPPLAEWATSAQGDVANLGVVVGERCVAVIDTGGSPAVGRALRLAIGRLTPLPVCHVINTHAHPDHMLGNLAFKGSGPDGTDPRYWAHAQFSPALAARERRFLGSLKQGIAPDSGPEVMVHPTDMVSTRQDIDLGGRSLRLVAWPTAHTNNDLSVLDLNSRTAFLGDLFFVSHLPVLDGSLRGWVKVMAQLQALDLALAVPGHGAPDAQWPRALQPQQAYLGHVLAATRAALKAGRTIRQAVEAIGVQPEGAAGPGAWQLSEFFHRRNLTAAFAELEWED